MTEPPRSAVEAFAQQFGVSLAYAESYLRRAGPPGPGWDLVDSELKALSVSADVEAVKTINDLDLGDAALTEDPEADLRRTIAERSNRHLVAQIAANTRWASTPEDERREATRKAREAFDERFDREVDPDNLLDPVERARRAGHARKAYFARLALKSAQARRRRA